MYAVTEFSRNTQRTLCMLLSAAIVTVSLSLGVLGAQPVEHGYSVTVTQIQ
jgi:hypothetical protein